MRCLTCPQHVAFNDNPLGNRWIHGSQGINLASSGYSARRIVAGWPCDVIQFLIESSLIQCSPNAAADFGVAVLLFTCYPLVTEGTRSSLHLPKIRVRGLYWETFLTSVSMHLAGHSNR
jgi:hypothetical protein